SDQIGSAAIQASGGAAGTYAARLFGLTQIEAGDLKVKGGGITVLTSSADTGAGLLVDNWTVGVHSTSPVGVFAQARATSNSPGYGVNTFASNQPGSAAL